jgi:hypothetical protein
MLHKLFISSLLVLLLAGCGDKTKGIGANILTPRTPAVVQSRAETIILSNNDMTYKTYQNSGASLQVREQMMGMRLSVLTPQNSSGVNTVTVTSVEKVDNTCKTGIYQGSISPAAFKDVNTWNNISGLGRFQCLDSNCDYLLLMIEQVRVVWNTSNGIGQSTTSSVPVVFEHQDNGNYNPTDSSANGTALASYFLITASQEAGAIACYEAVKTPVTPVNPVSNVTNGTPSSNTGVVNNSWFN